MNTDKKALSYKGECKTQYAEIKRRSNWAEPIMEVLKKLIAKKPSNRSLVKIQGI